MLKLEGVAAGDASLLKDPLRLTRGVETSRRETERFACVCLLRVERRGVKKSPASGGGVWIVVLSGSIDAMGVLIVIVGSVTDSNMDTGSTGVSDTLGVLVSPEAVFFGSFRRFCFLFLGPMI